MFIKRVTSDFWQHLEEIPSKKCVLYYLVETKEKYSIEKDWT